MTNFTPETMKVFSLFVSVVVKVSFYGEMWMYLNCCNSARLRYEARMSLILKEI